MPETIEKTEIKEVNLDSAMYPWAVEALNNNDTTFGEVIRTLVTVAGYDESRAQSYAHRVDRDGKALVYWNTKEKCDFLIKAFANVKVVANLIEV